MERNRLIVLALLLAVAHAAATFSSCTISTYDYTSGAQPPRIKVILTANGTIATSPEPDAAAPLFSLIRVMNASNDAELVPDYKDGAYVIDDNVLTMMLVAERGQIGDVQITYEKQPYQPYDITVDGEPVTEIDLECTNDLATTLFRGQTVDPPSGSTREVHIFFTRDVKRCDGELDELLNNTWFVYEGTSEPTLENVTYLCNSSLSHGFVPYEGSLSHWYCVADDVIASSTDLQSVYFDLTVGYVCDAIDDSNVTTHGVDGTEHLIVLGPEGSPANLLKGALYPDGTVYMFPVLPANSATNFTETRPCVWTYASSTYAVKTCCDGQSASWVRPDAIQYQCETPYLDYQLGEDVDFLLLGDEYYYFALPGSPAGPYPPKEPGIDATGTTVFRIVRDQRIKGIYRVDDYHLRIEFYNNVGWGVAVGNLIAFDDTKQYNATNVTRYDSTSADYGYDEDNELPALGSTFKAYFLQFGDATGGTADSVPYPPTTPVVITAVPSSSSTSSKDADLTDLSTGWQIFVWVGWGAFILGTLILLSVGIHRSCTGNGYLSATSYPHNL